MLVGPWKNILCGSWTCDRHSDIKSLEGPGPGNESAPDSLVRLMSSCSLGTWSGELKVIPSHTHIEAISGYMRLQNKTESMVGTRVGSSPVGTVLVPWALGLYLWRKGGVVPFSVGTKVWSWGHL